MTFPGIISAALARLSVTQDRDPNVVAAAPGDAAPLNASRFENLKDILEQVPAIQRVRDMGRMPASRYASEFVAANLVGDILARRTVAANHATVVMQPNGTIQVTKSNPNGVSEILPNDAPEAAFAVTMAQNALRRTAINALQLLRDRATPVNNLHFAVNLLPQQADATRVLDLSDVADANAAGRFVADFKQRTSHSLLVNATPNRVIVEINWPNNQIRVIAAGDALRAVGWDKVLGGGQTPVAKAQ